LQAKKFLNDKDDENFMKGESTSFTRLIFLICSIKSEATCAFSPGNIGNHLMANNGEAEVQRIVIVPPRN
jgi:hypothetical protein